MEPTTNSRQNRISVPVVNPSARDRLQNLITRTMAPHTVESILASAINGDLRDQSLVFIAMLDTWPRLAKAIGEVARETAKAPFEVKPFAWRNEDPSPRAVELAEFVEDTIAGLRPNPIDEGLDFKGLIASMAYGYYTGHAVAEIHYHPNGTPRAFDYLAARYYGYPREYDAEDRLMLNPSGHYNGQLHDFDEYPNRFLVGINRSHLGHASIAAPMRSLVQWWLASHYGLKWFMAFAQSFGSPVRWATYPSGDACAMNLVSEMLENMGVCSWGAFPEGTNLEILNSGMSAGDLPQKELIEAADRQADIAILGQSLTTDVGNSGSRALGDVHEGVRHDAIDAVAQWACGVLTHQFIPATLNSAGIEIADEMPRIEVCWPEAEDEKAKAERDEILISKIGLPVSKSWFYDRHGVPMPEGEEDLLEVVKQAPPPMAGQEEPTEGEDETTPVEARSQKAPARVLDRPVVDQLTDNVLENLSGTAAVFLSGVRPAFRNLVSLALDGSVSDADFIQALEKAANNIPELFESLNIDALQSALEEAIGTGMLAGAGERILSR